MKQESAAIQLEDSSGALSRLKDIVHRGDLRYEIWPEWLVVRDQAIKVGFNLQLFAKPSAEGGHTHPGCEKCRKAFNDMREVAEWIIPKGVRQCRYEIEPFENAWAESPTEKFIPEVPLTIRIVHRCGFDLPVDDCETRCLQDMTARLDALGVRAGGRPRVRPMGAVF